MGAREPALGMSGWSLLDTITSSNGYLPSLLRHWPPTSGVLATLGTGPPLQEILPTTVSRSTPLMALARACLSSTLPDALRAAAATSNRACTNPIGWVHCLPVAAWYSSATLAALAPVSEDVKGWAGLHQTSVDMPSPMSPRASTEAGNSRALPTEAILGWNPCWEACFQKVVQSGGIGTPVTISALAALKAEIWEEKSSVRFW